MPATTSKPETEFVELLELVRAGSQAAAWELVQRYSSKILRVVRRRLPDALRSKFDSQDFVQATWASIFLHASQLDRFDHPDNFTAFIAAVACNKVKIEIRRRLYSQKFNVTHERPFEDSPARLGNCAVAGDATPSQVAIAREQWFKLVHGQPAHYQRAIEMRFAGSSIREIAKELQLHEGTVQRVLRRMRVEDS